ncbi:hypothetical protein IH824_20815 [candidate division KSB1 bacterium]|nr:hypothetical protein [candidate division KSB1 bacterium]
MTKPYERLIAGNAAALAVAYGLDDEEIEAEFPELIKERIWVAFNDPDERFHKSVCRARERLYFLVNK